jgi:hypothetical protein
MAVVASRRQRAWGSREKKREGKANRGCMGCESFRTERDGEFMVAPKWGDCPRNTGTLKRKILEQKETKATKNEQLAKN